jgi:uncharacterized protein (DUF305 family)
MISRTRLPILLLLLTGLLSACGQAAPAQAPSAPTPAAGHGGHGEMLQSEDTPYDVIFIDGMIEHHEGAIRMAEQALQESERPELRAMAEEIVSVQQAEIEQLRQWRDEWYPDEPESEIAHMDMGMMEIPQDERPFDLRFLEAMISHHQGAIHMAQTALEQAERPEIRQMAEEVIIVQQAEIDQMQQWAAEWGQDS